MNIPKPQAPSFQKAAAPKFLVPLALAAMESTGWLRLNLTGKSSMRFHHLEKQISVPFFSCQKSFTSPCDLQCLLNKDSEDPPPPKE